MEVESGLPMCQIEAWFWFFMECSLLMWGTIWECLSVPITAVVTGKYQGYPVSRNPFSWLGMLLWGIFLIPFTIFIYPLIMLMLWVGFVVYVRKGNHAEITDCGIDVTTSKGDLISQHEWEDIAKVSIVFEAPSFHPVLHLVDGGLVHLHCGASEAIMKACKEKGVKVNETDLIGDN